MTGYIVRRMGQILVTLFLIISLAFFLIQAQPGDYTSVYAQNPDIPPKCGPRYKRLLAWTSPLGSNT